MKGTTETIHISVPSVQSKARIWLTLRLSAMQSRGRVGGSNRLAVRNYKDHLNLALGRTITLGVG